MGNVVGVLLCGGEPCVGKAVTAEILAYIDEVIAVFLEESWVVP